MNTQTASWSTAFPLLLAAILWSGVVNQTQAVPLAPNDPSISANLQLWLRADFGVAVSGSTITSWQDFAGNLDNSSNPRNANAFNIPLAGQTAPMAVETVSNGGQTFQVINTGAGTFNSANGGTNNGAGVGSGGSGGFRIPSTENIVLGSGVGSTQFIVVQTDTPNVQNARLIGSDLMGVGTAHRNMTQTFTPTDGWGSYDGVTFRQSAIPMDDGDYHVLAVRHSGSDTILFSDMVQESFGAANLPLINALNIGHNSTVQDVNNRIFKGRMTHILIYNAALSDSQINDISLYLGQATGIFPVPEPSGFGLLVIGMMALMRHRRDAGGQQVR